MRHHYLSLKSEPRNLGNSPRRGRSGFGTVELVVSMVLFGVLVSSIGPVVRHISASNRLNEQRQIAQVELANLMEQISTLPPSQLTPDRVEAIRLEATQASQLAGADLKAVVGDEADGLRQVTLSLTWKPESGSGMTPVHLTAWFRSDSSRSEDAS